MSVKALTNTTLWVEVWTPDPDAPEYVFDHLEDHGIGRKVVAALELEENRIETDEEGNRLCSYTVEIIEGGLTK
jgi:hypothetical protein